MIILPDKPFNMMSTLTPQFIDSVHLVDLAPLARLMGAALQRVDYWCLKHEADPEDIAHPHFFLGGVVKLTLDNQPLFVTWAKEKQRPATSSLSLQDYCAWQPDYYTELEASATPYWQRLTGRRLIQADLMGWRGVASVAALSFENQIIYIGTGNGLDYGYGDDILIRSQETFWQSPHVQDLEILHSIRPGPVRQEVMVA